MRILSHSVWHAIVTATLQDIMELTAVLTSTGPDGHFTFSKLQVKLLQLISHISRMGLISCEGMLQQRLLVFFLMTMFFFYVQERYNQMLIILGL